MESSYKLSHVDGTTFGKNRSWRWLLATRIQQVTEKVLYCQGYKEEENASLPLSTEWMPSHLSNNYVTSHKLLALISISSSLFCFLALTIRCSPF